MPEHFHVLLKPEPADLTPKIVQQLKQRTALHILGALREHEQHPWCDRMLRRLRLPATVHSQARHRVWERRYYPFNVYSDQKLQEKLDYMHANPVKRGLVSSPEEWLWSSLGRRQRGEARGEVRLESWPLPRPRDWAARVNRAETEAQVEAIRRSIARGCPFGEENWQQETAANLGLE